MSCRRKRRDALVVCDIQPDGLGAITPVARREAVLYWVQCCTRLAVKQNWTVCYTGLQFSAAYQDVPTAHKLFGSLTRLHKLMGEAQVHWFLPGYPGSAIHSSVLPTDIDTDANVVFWRNRHVPTTTALLEHLQAQDVTHVTLVGIKVSTSIQIWAQRLCDMGYTVYIVTQAVADDAVSRQSTVLEQLLPLYAAVLDIVDWIDECQFPSDIVEQVISKQLPDPPNVKWICYTGRAGHGALFTKHLLQNYPNVFQPFPPQRWYQKSSSPAGWLLGQGNQDTDYYYCPLGKKVVHFCDEPQFSHIAMYVKGRETWDEKDKLVQLARVWASKNNATNVLKHPPTYFIGPNHTWIHESDSDSDTGSSTSSSRGPPSTPPTSSEDATTTTVWFLKATNKNGGKAVSMHASPEACLAAAQPGQRYVVQRHIPNPLLTVDGYKCHVKFYSLLIGDGTDDADTCWTLYTYRDAFLAVAEQPWNATATTEEVQITTLRTFRLQADAATDPCEAWCIEDFYTPCRKGVEAWMGAAIALGKLQGRPAGQRQFELFSADFLFAQDDRDHPYLIEFNGGPVLFDAQLQDQVLATRGLQRYHRLYQFYGDEAPVNDHAMIRDALTLGLNLQMDQHEELPAASVGKWERVRTFHGLMNQEES